MELTILGLLLLIVLLLLFQINELQSRLKRTDYLISAITKHIGLTEHPVNSELRLLITEGKRIEAIKKQEKFWGYR
ncbi:hypothetical protein [Brevibacillus borstelensis]|uniref:hypothetical protein n=1 Tax=Brevibacillus borstelensis TaxID=45462 RepID=UPI0030C40A5D